MIHYAGMKAQESGNGNNQLPVGAYVAKVIKARITGLAPDQQLEIMLDICEGDYKDFYMNKFKAQKAKGGNYEVKYKGIYRLRVPNPDNKKAMYPESDIRRFNDMLARFENSNPGVNLYNNDGFDEGTLTGLLVGVSTQEDSYNGNSFTRIGRLENVNDVRMGTVRPMKAREGNPTTAPAVDQRSGMTNVTAQVDDELPWD